MSSNSSFRKFFPSRSRTIGLAASLLFAIAAFDLLAVAGEQGEPTPFQSVLAVPPGLVGDEWTGGPRECDIPNGISTACIFLD